MADTKHWFLSSLQYIFLCLFLISLYQSLLSSLSSSPQSSTVFALSFANVSFDSTSLGTTSTVLTLQLVVNPLLKRESFDPARSKLHDAIFDSLTALNADLVRYQTWYPYPRLGVAALDRPSGYHQCGNVGLNYSISLSCLSVGGVIKSIDFASFGLASGYCGSFKENTCHSTNSTSIVEKLCLNKTECIIPATIDLFGSPCTGHEADYRLAISVQCDPPQLNNYWNFSSLNPIVEDYMASTVGARRILNFCTLPNWLFNLTGYAYHYAPDNEDQADFHYPQGRVLYDLSGDEVSDYFGRIISYYTNGGFIDEYGRIISSPYHYSIDIFEVLNEIDDKMDISTYTTIYDAAVRGVRKWADPNKKVQFMGLALAGARTAGFNLSLIEYFLNSSNHREEVLPIDYISLHFYGHPADRLNVSEYQQIYSSTDIFIGHLTQIQEIVASLSPTTQIALDEVGTILPDDNNSTVPAPMFPLIYWNAAAAGYAYMYLRVSPLSIFQLGHSQLVGFPSLPQFGLAPQYPSVAMLNWTNGMPNAKYQVLQMMKQQLGPGDIIIQTNIKQDTQQQSLFAQVYATQTNNNIPNPQVESYHPSIAVFSNYRLLLINTADSPVVVFVNSSAGSILSWVDLSTGGEVARRETIQQNSFQLNEFAVAILTLPPTTSISLD